MISDASSSSYNTTFEMFIDLLSDPSLLLPAKVYAVVSITNGVLFIICLSMYR